jgi:ADP-heptose:LPS heptosyltransferase
MQPDPFRSPERILVIRPDNIGDVILTGPLFRNLSRHYPSATLGILASRAGATAAPLLPWIDEVVEAQPVWQDLGGRLPQDPDRELEFVEFLRGGRWDVAIIATSFRQTAWPAAYATYLAGIPLRVGFAPDFGGSLLTHPVDPPPVEVHQAVRNLRLLEAIGVPVLDDDLEIVLPVGAAASIDARLASRGISPREPILVVPGASAPARRMAPERYGRAAALLGAATGRPVVVAGTPKERALVEACVATIPGGIPLAGDLSVPEFAALVDAAAIVLCGNSSALHLADATRRPVVAAFAGTDLVSQWEPRASRASLLSVPVACSPCYRIECPIGNACLSLDPDDIAHRALAILEEAPGAIARPATGAARARRRSHEGGIACVA